jgi:hypothetical protein
LELTLFLELIGTVGFPIACVIALGIFVFIIYKDTKNREAKLYEEIGKNREVNAQAMAILAQYADRLEMIQSDVNDIKTDITIITTKLEQ